MLLKLLKFNMMQRLEPLVMQYKRKSNKVLVTLFSQTSKLNVIRLPLQEEPTSASVVQLRDSLNVGQMSLRPMSGPVTIMWI